MESQTSPDQPVRRRSPSHLESSHEDFFSSLSELEPRPLDLQLSSGHFQFPSSSLRASSMVPSPLSRDQSSGSFREKRRKFSKDEDSVAEPLVCKALFFSPGDHQAYAPRVDVLSTYRLTWYRNIGMGL